MGAASFSNGVNSQVENEDTEKEGNLHNFDINILNFFLLFISFLFTDLRN